MGGGGGGSCRLSRARPMPWLCKCFLFQPFIAGGIGGPGLGELALAFPVLTNDLLGVQLAWGQTRALVQRLDAAPLPPKARQERGQGRPQPSSQGAAGVLTKTSPPSQPVCLPARPHPFKDTPGKCREGCQE